MSLPSGFIDLATYDSLEQYMYGGGESYSYFIRKVRKATWFTIVPVNLTKSAGMAQFGQTWSVNISRSGDYFLNCWLKVTLPAVSIATGNRFGANGSLRWTRNFMHALLKEVNISFNDLVEMRLDSSYLDFYSQFCITAGKRNGYNNMIGNIDELTNPGAAGISVPVQSLPAQTLLLPIPIAHARDSGVALPTASLPYNEMKLNFEFRDWTQLLIIDNVATGVSTAASASDVQGTPMLSGVDVGAHYAMVANSERAKMANQARDILIEQVQSVPAIAFNPQNTLSSTDIRLSHAVKCLFFGVRNKTNPAEWSNYTAASPFPTNTGVLFSPELAADPIERVTLMYENTPRLNNLGAEYFALINPWYYAPSIPVETGYHMYSYSLDIMDVNPKGSTNFGRLTNVSLQLTPSAAAQTAGASTGNISNPNTTLASQGAATAQIFEFVLVAVSHNVISVRNGALGALGAEVIYACLVQVLMTLAFIIERSLKQVHAYTAGEVLCRGNIVNSPLH